MYKMQDAKQNNLDNLSLSIQIPDKSSYSLTQFKNVWIIIKL